jgi:hypothetical protein
MHKHYSIQSLFQSLLIKAFIYPAQKQSSATVFILKGLYSVHDPKRTDSWERQLIDERGEEHTFVCINTARLSVADPTSRDAFVGKTFMQECDDISRMFEYLVKEGVVSKSLPIVIIAHSFGGTTLLGTPTVLKQASAVIMIASGCGKSPTTNKPLLSSLYTEEELLMPLRTYNGIFMYIRGTKDAVVPKESQDKIIAAATSARVRIVSDILDAEHNLTSSTLHKIPSRSSMLISSLDTVLLLTIH